MSADKDARARVSRRQLKAAAAARSFDPQYVYGAPPILERHAKPVATRRPHAPLRCLIHDARVVWLGEPPFDSWNDLPCDAKEALLQFIGESVWADDWERAFVRRVWEAGDDAKLSHAHLALLDELVAAAMSWIFNTAPRRRELFGGAR